MGWKTINYWKIDNHGFSFENNIGEGFYLFFYENDVASATETIFLGEDRTKAQSEAMNISTKIANGTYEFQKKKPTESAKPKNDTTYLILSGESDQYLNEDQWVTESNTLKEAEQELEALKESEHYKNTDLFIFEAKLVKQHLGYAEGMMEENEEENP